MALSSWDALCVNEKGQSCIAEHEFKNNIKIRLHKCWLNIYDEKAWVLNSGFIRPVIAQIYSSEMNYKGINILSSFDGDTSTICFIVWTGYEHENNVKGMMGIGAYGEEPSDFSDPLDKSDDDLSDSEYIGITDQHIKMLDEFRNKEFASMVVPSVFVDIDLLKCRRYNQGDKIFHDRLGTELNCSEVGKADEPVLSFFLKNMFKK